MPAPLFPANAHRFDPYRTYKFQVLIDGQPVAGLKKMGALKKKTEPIKWRAAGDPSHERVLPGGTSYEPIVLDSVMVRDIHMRAGTVLGTSRGPREPHRMVDTERDYFDPPATIRLPFVSTDDQPVQLLVEYAYCFVDFQCFFGEAELTVATVVP